MAFRQTINLGNSIIGVSILTMPYCFRSCGIVLSIFIIILSGFLNRAGCHLLVRSAVMSRKRGFEMIAFDTLGSLGKLLVELCVLGYLLGTCVAYFVVIGDLGPSIISDIFDIPNSAHLRVFTMTFVGIFIALPLGLLRRVESLSSCSVLSFGLYLFLVLKLFSEASIHFLLPEDSPNSDDFFNKIVLWDMSGLLKNLPIFAMALSCQTQLFELVDVNQLNFDDPHSTNRLNGVVRRAVMLCSSIYITVGLFGYVAFHDKPFGGNILSFLPASLGSTVAKVGFIATVAVSLPLCLFPCRTSLHSLFIRSRDSRSSLLNEVVVAGSSTYMSDRQFRYLTICLVVVTICMSIVVPHIEFVLSIIGSTTGAIICFVLPGMIYCSLTSKSTTERLLARFLTYFGFFLLIACTLSTLHSGQETITDQLLNVRAHHEHPKIVVNLAPVIESVKDIPIDLKRAEKTILKEEDILQKLEKQQEEHKQLIEEQKELLREMKKHEKSNSHFVKSSEVSSSSILPVVKDKANDTETHQIGPPSNNIISDTNALSSNKSNFVPESRENTTNSIKNKIQKKKMQIMTENRKKLTSRSVNNTSGSSEEQMKKVDGSRDFKK